MPDKPIIKKFVKLECRANRKNNIKYEYENEVNSWIIYNFESSHPEIFKVSSIINLLTIRLWNLD